MIPAQPDFTMGHVQFHGKTLQLRELDMLLRTRKKERLRRRLRDKRLNARKRDEGRL